MLLCVLVISYCVGLFAIKVNASNSMSTLWKSRLLCQKSRFALLSGSACRWTHFVLPVHFQCISQCMFILFMLPVHFQLLSRPFPPPLLNDSNPAMDLRHQFARVPTRGTFFCHRSNLFVRRQPAVAAGCGFMCGCG